MNFALICLCFQSIRLLLYTVTSTKWLYLVENFNLLLLSANPMENIFSQNLWWHLLSISCIYQKHKMCKLKIEKLTICPTLVGQYHQKQIEYWACRGQKSPGSFTQTYRQLLIDILLLHESGFPQYEADVDVKTWW